MIPFPGAFFVGVAIFLIVVWDAFEAIILPRRPLYMFGQMLESHPIVIANNQFHERSKPFS